MYMSEKEKVAHIEALTCYMCDFPFSEANWKTADHDHTSGYYLGATHNNCNFNRIEKSLCKVFFHAFQAYDSHIIVQNLDHPGVKSVDIIPRSSEKFMSVGINRCWTLTDSWNFLSSPLDTLVSTLDKKTHKFPILRQTKLVQDKKGEIDEKKVNLLLSKGCYPYEYAKCYDDLLNCKKFPPHKAFYSSLREKNISIQEYNRGQEVFDVFECDSLATYMDIYCELDVLLLAEVFTKFRKSIFEQFEIDATNFISLPALSLQCFLKYSKVKFELLTDRAMYDMIRNHVRGGLSFVGQRLILTKHYLKKHNLPPIIDEYGREIEVIYIDANNLYGTRCVKILVVGVKTPKIKEIFKQTKNYSLWKRKNDSLGKRKITRFYLFIY